MPNTGMLNAKLVYFVISCLALYILAELCVGNYAIKFNKTALYNYEPDFETDCFYL